MLSAGEAMSVHLSRFSVDPSPADRQSAHWYGVVLLEADLTRCMLTLLDFGFLLSLSLFLFTLALNVPSHGDTIRFLAHDRIMMF